MFPLIGFECYNKTHYYLSGTLGWDLGWEPISYRTISPYIKLFFLNSSMVFFFCQIIHGACGWMLLTNLLFFSPCANIYIWHRI